MHNNTLLRRHRVTDPADAIEVRQNGRLGWTESFSDVQSDFEVIARGFDFEVIARTFDFEVIAFAFGSGLIFLQLGCEACAT